MRASGRGATRHTVVGLRAIAVLLCLLLAQPGRAQVAMPGVSRGPSDLTELAVTPESLLAYCDLLGLTRKEREPAIELHTSYLESFREMARRFDERARRVQAEVRETRDVAAMKRMPALMRELMGRMRELEDGLFRDLRAVSGMREDDARWAAVQRLRRREQAQHTPSVSGDATDLTGVMSRVQSRAEWPPPVAEALLRYELELDGVLAQRQRMVREAMSKTADLMEASFDPERESEAEAYWAPFLEKMQDLSLQAKRINIRSAAEIEQLLGGEAQRIFAREVKRAIWPGVYRDSYPQRLLGVARRLADVTGEQEAQLATVEREYEAAASVINDRWRRLIDAREEQAEGPMGGFLGPHRDEESEEAKARRQRAELDRTTAQRIRQLLTPAQQARLPHGGDIAEEDHG